MTDDKKNNGVVYTPRWIVELILDHVNYKQGIYNKKIVDPACGDGAFLTVIVERFIKDALASKLNKKTISQKLFQNVYGFEIDPAAAAKCRAILDEVVKKYGLDKVTWNIIAIDSLNKTLTKNFSNLFDFVVGNPPYVRIQNLTKEVRSRLQLDWTLCMNGSTDIFIAFFELGYYLLNKSGQLGYITPNTYLKTKAGEKLRVFIKTRKILKTLIDFGHNQLFDDATTYSLITILSKTGPSDYFDLYKGEKHKVNFVEQINITNLNDNNWILAPAKILNRLKLIETRGVSLSKIAKICVGIATLADDYYIFKNPDINKSIAEIKLKDGRSFKIEKSILKPIVKASILKSSDDDQNRFIIFPYKAINKKNVIIPEVELRSKYPLTYKYFMSIKDTLDARDSGKPNPVAWYAFGRSQGLDSTFGEKILTSPMNLKPNFIVWDRPEYAFYAGYGIKFKGNLEELSKSLNSEDMEFYITNTSRDYQHKYKSFAKSFIENFGIENSRLKLEFNQQKLL